MSQYTTNLTANTFNTISYNPVSGLQPGVWKLKAIDEKATKYFLEYVSEKFTVPEKIYGSAADKATRIWNDYALSNKSTGCLLLGDKGSGKTLLATLIANLGIHFGIPVIMVSELEINISLITFLSACKKCILFLDEFGKGFRYNVQDQMLTMLSDLNNTHKLFIITENYEHCVNSCILDRPGRIKYRLDFNKLEEDVLEEYVQDFNIKQEFLEDLKERYKNVTEFSFDQLEAIVKEHLQYPNDTLEDILNILNTKSLRLNARFRIVGVTKDGKEYTFYVANPAMLNENILKTSLYGLSIDVTPLKSESGELDTSKVIYVRYEDIEPSNTENEYTATVSCGFHVKLIKTYQ